MSDYPRSRYSVVNLNVPGVQRVFKQFPECLTDLLVAHGLGDVRAALQVSPKDEQVTLYSLSSSFSGMFHLSYRYSMGRSISSVSSGEISA